jgi:hypothetical protein
MKKCIAQLLSVNPLLGLALVVVYIGFFWHVTATIWANDYELFAIVFALSITIATKSQSAGLIDELERIKSAKARKEQNESL